MIFSLDVRRARKGDCLLLHFGSNKEPGLVMIDGGPRGVYESDLKPRIGQIRERRRLAENRPLKVDVLMVSHVDDDHIQGILELTSELVGAAREGRPQPIQVFSFWHNSFDEIIGHTPDDLMASVKTQFGPASVGGDGELPDDAKGEVEEKYDQQNPDEDPDENLDVVSSTLKVLASVEQGFRLRQNASALNDVGRGFDRNPEFNGGLIVAREGGGEIPIAEGLKFTVVGPMLPELRALHKKHQEWLERLKAKGKAPPAAETLAAYVDKSVPNLSSLVVMAEAGGKRMLLTGDARGDKVLRGLQFVGLLDAGDDGKIEVEVLKVPHHGSANNLNDDFFRRIIARHYVFSGDGEHGNPEREALEMLLRARGDAGYTIHLTYPIDVIDKGREDDWNKERNKQLARRNKNPDAKVREEWSADAHSLAALFRDNPDFAKTVKIVGAEEPHLIDLLDGVEF